MKIILTAFGKMKSEPMDVPENTGTTWDMVLTQPISVFKGYNGVELSTKQPFDKRCRFEWTGEMYNWRVGDKYESARKYVLTDIS